MRVESVVPLSAARCKALLVDFITVRVYGAIVGNRIAAAVYNWVSSLVGAENQAGLVSWLWTSSVAMLTLIGQIAKDPRGNDGHRRRRVLSDIVHALP